MLIPHFSAVLVERVVLERETIRVLARTRSRRVPWPDCSVRSSRVHSTYERRLADTPVGGQPVLVELTVRRLYCENKDWIGAVRTEDLPGLNSFATGLEKDWDAVIQGLSSRWSSGPVEGRVNHIKMIKRQMFGRAKLPLLRKRVLLTARQPGVTSASCA
ncbi:transposase family protein [Streptomyces sp. SAS_270]|uniref:transposase family protein n=1 Tax=Streptomyces sp. SAS_270 TaxID=3412748 RepID=UPI00403D5006